MIVWCQKCNTYPLEISTDNAEMLTADMLRPECPVCRGYAVIAKTYNAMAETFGWAKP